MQLVVGRIARPHGIRGDVLVEVRTDTPDRRFAAGAQLCTDPADRGPLTVASSRLHSGLLIVAFAEVADRTAAEALRGTFLVLDSSELGPTGDPDEFHDHELIGLAAFSAGGERLGVVTDVLHHGQDLLVIERDGLEELLVPFVAPLVPEVDVAAGRMVIDPPPGLLDP
ncbi:MAG TPA: ribosome maturation factor RimM [Streptosporangiaceae bacterium]|jgi:16S rRNA processing protein RimM